MLFDPSVFKAYDVRGLYASQINEQLTEAIGRAFVAHLNARRVVVSRDMRLSSPALAQAFIAGARTQGADVTDIGLMGTDQMYFAVARDGYDGGAQITASHNPGRYNGVKLVGREALPLSGDSGIPDIRDMLLADTVPPKAERLGSYEKVDVFRDYIDHILTFVDSSAIKSYSLALDAGCGMAGQIKRLAQRPAHQRIAQRHQREREGVAALRVRSEFVQFDDKIVHGIDDRIERILVPCQQHP